MVAASVFKELQLGFKGVPVIVGAPNAVRISGMRTDAEVGRVGDLAAATWPG